MTRFLLFTAAACLLVAAGVIVSPPSSQARAGAPLAARPRPQTTSPMLCRGGPGGALNFSTIDSGLGPIAGRVVTYDLLFTPSPAAAGANGRGLSPGQCSWLDRPISAQEPGLIRFKTPYKAQWAQEQNGGPVDNSPTAAERFPDAFTIPSYLRDPDHYYQFTVYNFRNEYFLATASRYFKPRITVEDGIRVGTVDHIGSGPRIDLNALEARGGTIAEQDPLALMLRDSQTSDARRRGFDIGMAAAEGQTEPGPGKQRIHDQLAPAEQPGFEDAVTFSLDRNRNRDLAAVGARIADADPFVAERRNIDTNAFYRLGFDIATGIFGDPALGAKGNTATGPGSLRIRDSLSRSGQLGFNAAVTYHLGRTYRR